MSENLDDSSHDDLLMANKPWREIAADPHDGCDGNEGTVELACIVDHMSRVIARQQQQMTALLRELSRALERQTMLASLQQELAIARKMQSSILPRHPPSVPGVEVKALMVPAHEVGGDFYDYFLIDDNHLVIVIADVSGKGIPAAFFMAITRSLLKSSAIALREPAQVLSRLNEQLCAENEQMMFVTAFFAVLDLRSGVLDFVNAGHNPPVVRDRKARVRMLAHSQNVALAVLKDARYQPGRVVLGAGDTLLLYTDGVIDANDPSGRMFGEQRLLNTVSRYRPGEGCLAQQLLREVRAFESGRPQVDDMTCVVLRYLPEN